VSRRGAGGWWGVVRVGWSGVGWGGVGWGGVADCQVPDGRRDPAEPPSPPGARFNIINGVLLPGGGANLHPGHPFYDAAAQLINLAIRVGPGGTGAGGVVTSCRAPCKLPHRRPCTKAHGTPRPPRPTTRATTSRCTAPASASRRSPSWCAPRGAARARRPPRAAARPLQAQGLLTVQVMSIARQPLHRPPPLPHPLQSLQISGNYSILSETDAENAPATLLYTDKAEDSHLFQCASRRGGGGGGADVRGRPRRAWRRAAPAVRPAAVPRAPAYKRAPRRRSLPPSVVRNLQNTPIAMENHMHGKGGGSGAG
jgi:hypothetical protein